MCPGRIETMKMHIDIVARTRRKTHSARVNRRTRKTVVTVDAAEHRAIIPRDNA